MNINLTIRFVCVTALLGSCQLTKHQIRRAIEGGARPAEAQCALTARNTTNEAYCTMIAMKRCDNE
jgi:hypothetical protein